MPRIRTIKPDFCTSPSTRRLSRDARLFFLQLLTEADDEGRFVASAKLLAGSLYPHDDDVTAARVNKWLAELEAPADDPVVVLYEHDGVRYGHFVHWAAHQKISHPTASRLPPPPSGNAPESFRNHSADRRETFPPDLGSGSGKGKGSSSTSVSEEPAPPSAEGEEEDLKLRAVADELGRRDARAACDRGVGIGDFDAYAAACARKRLDDQVDELRRLLGDHDDWSVERLARVACGDRRLPEFEPLPDIELDPLALAKGIGAARQALGA